MLWILHPNIYTVVKANVQMFVATHLTGTYWFKLILIISAHYKQNTKLCQCAWYFSSKCQSSVFPRCVTECKKVKTIQRVLSSKPQELLPGPCHLLLLVCFLNPQRLWGPHRGMTACPKSYMLTDLSPLFPLTHDSKAVPLCCLEAEERPEVCAQPYACVYTNESQTLTVHIKLHVS